MSSSTKSLALLPTELIVEVFAQSPNFSVVWALLNTSARMRAIFNSQAQRIVNAVLESTVPETDLYMRLVLVLRTTGTIAHSTYQEARKSTSNSIKVPKITGTPYQLRSFVRFAHEIHGLAHYCIDKALQRCLASPLGQIKYNERFKHPTWFEEQRVLRAFWRVVFFNKLERGVFMETLEWTSSQVEDMRQDRRYHDFKSPTAKYTAIMVLRFIGEQTYPGRPEGFYPLVPLPFRLTWLPGWTEFRSFRWTCQSPTSALVEIDEEDLESIRSGEQSESDDAETEWDESESDNLLLPQRPASWRYVGGPVLTEHPLPDSLIIPPVRLIIESPSYYPLGDEWRMVQEESTGAQIIKRIYHRCGPVQFIRPEAFIRYGFAIWDEQRMIDMGVWAYDACLDATESLLRWYTFLSQEDLNWSDVRRFDDRYYPNGWVLGRMWYYFRPWR